MMSTNKKYAAQVWVLLALVCAGCANAAPAQVPDILEPTSPAPTATVLLPGPTDTAIIPPTAALQPTQAQAATEIPALPCSPLQDHLLAELREIISDPYHPPPMGKDDRHQGVDFSYYRRGERLSIQGVVVQSVLAGRVAAAISNSFPFGNLVIVETPSTDLPEWLRLQIGIESGESLYLLYAHMEKPPEVILGQEVAACQAIGLVGKSGNAGIAHLHLETRLGPPDTQFLEMGYYQASSTEAEKANYLLWRTSGTFLHFDPMRLLLAKQP